VASTYLPTVDRTGRSPQGGRGIRAFLSARADLRRLPTANDNAAPLEQRVRHGFFAVTTALAVAWLFWAGFLR
jgi:hypothetical protein